MFAIVQIEDGSPKTEASENRRIFLKTITFLRFCMLITRAWLEGKWHSTEQLSLFKIYKHEVIQKNLEKVNRLVILFYSTKKTTSKKSDAVSK